MFSTKIYGLKGWMEQQFFIKISANNVIHI